MKLSHMSRTRGILFLLLLALIAQVGCENHAITRPKRFSPPSAPIDAKAADGQLEPLETQQNAVKARPKVKNPASKSR